MTTSDKPIHYTMKAESGHINFSSPSFRRWAHEYYQHAISYDPGCFSPVPLALLCRAIELALKSIHLNSMRQPEVKSQFGHNLIKSYKALPDDLQALSEKEEATLTVASNVYSDRDKSLDYVQPIDAAHGYKRFPKFEDLKKLAEKILQITECGDST